MPNAPAARPAARRAAGRAGSRSSESTKLGSGAARPDGLAGAALRRRWPGGPSSAPARWPCRDRRGGSDHRRRCGNCRHRRCHHRGGAAAGAGTTAGVGATAGAGTGTGLGAGVAAAQQPRRPVRAPRSPATARPPARAAQRPRSARSAAGSCLRRTRQALERLEILVQLGDACGIGLAWRVRSTGARFGARRCRARRHAALAERELVGRRRCRLLLVVDRRLDLAGRLARARLASAAPASRTRDAGDRHRSRRSAP